MLFSVLSDTLGERIAEIVEEEEEEATWRGQFVRYKQKLCFKEIIDFQENVGYPYFK